MRRLSVSFEMVVLMLLVAVAILLIVFGVVVEARAVSIVPKPIPAAVTTQVLARFSKLIGTVVMVSSVQQMNVAAVRLRGSAADCSSRVFGIQDGYRVTFRYRQMWFDYQTDASLQTVVLCHIKLPA